MNVEMKPNGPFGPKAEGAITILEADHKRVEDLFCDLELLRVLPGVAEQKASLVNQLCNELKMHAALEETIFYPALRELIDDKNLIDEALAEHAAVTKLVAQLEKMDPDARRFDGMVVLLQERVAHHIQEDEVIFVKARAAKLDDVALGAQMARRTAELMADPKISATASKAADVTDALRAKQL